MPPLAWGVAVQDHAHAAFVAGWQGRVRVVASSGTSGSHVRQCQDSPGSCHNGSHQRASSTYVDRSR
jgi:hypothetical protein